MRRVYWSGPAAWLRFDRVRLRQAWLTHCERYRLGPNHRDRIGKVDAAKRRQLTTIDNEANRIDFRKLAHRCGQTVQHLLFVERAVRLIERLVKGYGCSAVFGDFDAYR